MMPIKPCIYELNAATARCITPRNIATTVRIHHAGSSSPKRDAVSPIIDAAIMEATRVAVSPK